MFFRHNQAQDEIHKLLLLGAGQSGKSTLFKQMISLYGTGFGEAERESYRPIIFGNVISSMQTLLEQADTFSSEDQKYLVDSKLKDDKDEIENARSDDQLDEKLAGMIERLWGDPAIGFTYERRSEYQLNESAKYYFDKVIELGQPEYIPSEEDLLRSRSRTTGVIENNFTIDGNHFQMYDVGGQRSERKKWIHCFENVSCVLFVAALSAYNQV
jgi:GTPase SAR1 family protein